MYRQSEAKIQRLYLVACPIVVNIDPWTGLWGANSETGPCGRFLFFDGQGFSLDVWGQLNIFCNLEAKIHRSA
jgi:hypothetical protein